MSINVLNNRRPPLRSILALAGSCALCLLLLSTWVRAEDGAEKSGGKALSIVALVNDEPITGYEVEQRQRLSGLGANVQGKAQENFQAMIKAPSTAKRVRAILEDVVKANPDKSKDEVLAIFEKRKKEFALGLQKQAVESARRSILPGLRKNALDDLVEEKIKMQEAKRLNAIIAEDDVNRVVNGMAERNKMSQEQFGKHLNTMGLELETMKQRVRVSLTWNDLVRRRFGQQVAISGSELERLVSKNPNQVADTVELKLQRIRLGLPAKIDQARVSQRLQEADQLRAQFKGCDGLNALAGSVTDARLDDLGEKKPSAIPEPTRTLLLAAGDGEMLPPSVGEGAVELWAVCGRKIVKGDEQQRQAAEGELKQKELEILAKRYLNDLRQDASIEMRSGG